MGCILIQYIINIIHNFNISPLDVAKFTILVDSPNLIITICMVAYFCHHLSDNSVDLSDNSVDLSDNYVDLSDNYVDLSLIGLLGNKS